ncbi:MAG: Fur family transcriptional regulator [Anaerolineae bacterium]
MSHNRSDYAALMRQRGFRVTPQRRLILDAICQGGGHTTPEEIYARVKSMAPAVNQATVYRTLEFLCQLGLVVSADIGIGQKVYEIAGDTPHHHLVCRQCEQVQSLDHTLVQPFFAQTEAETGFKVETDHLILFGLCERCRANPAPTPEQRA